MSRQTDINGEEREKARRNELVKALEFGIVEALEYQGIELMGFAFKYDAYNCLMTIKADVGGVLSVAFVGSDSLINCILKAQSEARRNSLHWRADRFKNE